MLPAKKFDTVAIKTFVKLHPGLALAHPADRSGQRIIRFKADQHMLSDLHYLAIQCHAAAIGRDIDDHNFLIFTGMCLAPREVGNA